MSRRSECPQGGEGTLRDAANVLMTGLTMYNPAAGMAASSAVNKGLDLYDKYGATAMNMGKKAWDAYKSGNLWGKVKSAVKGASLMAALGKLMKEYFEERQKSDHPPTLKKFIEKHADKYFNELIRKHHKQLNVKFLDKHEEEIIGIADMFGENGKKWGKALIKAIKAYQKRVQEIEKEKKGQGIKQDVNRAFGKINAASKQALQKLKDFSEGKTKLKPSQLTHYAATAVGLAGPLLAMVPDIGPVAVPIASGASAGLNRVAANLKHEGRGRFASRERIATALKKQHPWTQKLPKPLKRFVLENAALANKIDVIVREHHQRGSGKKKKNKGWKALGASLAAAGVVVPAGIQLAKWLHGMATRNPNPGLDHSIDTTINDPFADELWGQGSNRIKSVGSKAEVFAGSASKTSGGLRKADLMRNKRGKIVSKKKHAAGKRMYSNIKKYTFK